MSSHFRGLYKLLMITFTLAKPCMLGENNIINQIKLILKLYLTTLDPCCLVLSLFVRNAGCHYYLYFNQCKFTESGRQHILHFFFFYTKHNIICSKNIICLLEQQLITILYKT